MTGQDGGFRAAAARFKAEVEAALTRARRAADEAKAQAAEFRRGSDDLANQARTRRLRGARRGQVTPTSPEALAEASTFRRANGLIVEELPGADELTGRPPTPPAAQPQREDEDFSQHKVLFDLDAPDEPPAPAQPVDQTSDESPRIDSPTEPNTRRREENEDFSQQRILIDATVESYRPDPLPDPAFERPDDKNPS
ncbi:hypothetical protein [Actinophytocola sp.]|uniref:hypothetical protein n=1 Tax=Actinophytocola sp. TaxID=1872138 RepID=UPI003D6BC445